MTESKYQWYARRRQLQTDLGVKVGWWCVYRKLKFTLDRLYISDNAEGGPHCLHQS